jgi:hypothetical protein
MGIAPPGIAPAAGAAAGSWALPCCMFSNKAAAAVKAQQAVARHRNIEPS